MKNKMNICKICNCEIREDEPTFIFPKLHESLNLEYLIGESHSACLKEIDKKLEVSKLLATIRESIAKNSDESKLICRNGNIIVCARFDEKRVEIYDYEDFCSISISITDLEKILGTNPYRVIPIAKIEGFILNILKNGKLSLETLKYQYELSDLNLVRLREILSCIKIDIYFGESVQQEFIRKAKKDNKF
ncbi:hypothetical protein [Clostridium felsineum]|uniref:hypothetical protein n=1 Tax=Clostridium felsineum TaxID=36839 RepID=UPI00098C2830|nr:hypothetical protein [Clostridium felsineum]URZ03819.1 hypothetical protein CLAUR_038840 [Clostridium felsineum]